jgi:hypothetical protein
MGNNSTEPVIRIFWVFVMGYLDLESLTILV